MTQVEVPRSTRLLSLAVVVAGATGQGVLVRTGARRRQRLQMCTAARVLTALGARVRVIPPPVPWPRTGGSLVTGHDAGRLGDLAVLTAVPRAAAGWAELADRVLPFPGAATPAPEVGPVRCPVTVTCRTADGPLRRLPRGLGEVAALRGLVIEVWLLAPVAAGPVGQDVGAAGSAPAGSSTGGASVGGPSRVAGTSGWASDGAGVPNAA